MQVRLVLTNSPGGCTWKQAGGKTMGSCEVAGTISEGTRRTSGVVSRYGDPLGTKRQDCSIVL